MDDQNRNLILAVALSVIVLVVWTAFFAPEPTPPVEETVQTQAVTDGITAPAAATAGDSATATATTEASTETAIADAPRIAIETPSVIGTISLQGGRIDDLSLTQYNETLDAGSDLVRLLSPVGEENPYYSVYGWAPGAGVAPDAVPGFNTIWSAPADATLTPDTPVTLTWDNGAGLVFTREISVDDKFVFSITQSVTNTSDATVAVAPYGIVARHGLPDLLGFFIQHEGVVRMNDGVREEITYNNMLDFDADPRGLGVSETTKVTENGWIGFTDQYWMTALMAQPETALTTIARYNPRNSIYTTETIYPTRSVAAGATAEVTSYFYAGAQEWEAIKGYQENQGIDRFVDAIDWGWFFFLTKPIFQLLHGINGLIGNMGWAILLLTLIIKAILFPLAFRSYVSMAKMRELQPEMEKLREKHGEDRQAMQQGMMKLYRENKVNPASGCLPILLQIPIFFSLYKVIFVTIELRHAPWFGWIKDLSAPDPSSILNFFGAAPWPVPELGIFGFLSLGILPILLGVSMWLQQKLNPAPTDPTQQVIFAWMPWVFMFMLGSFASGLVVYWIANNTITFTQQYLIMRSQGYTPDLLGNIKATFSRKKDAE